MGRQRIGVMRLQIKEQLWLPEAGREAWNSTFRGSMALLTT